MKVSAPRKGSLRYSPRKRVKNQIISLNYIPVNGLGFIFGIKAGMTYLKNNNMMVPCTVIDLIPLKIIGFVLYSIKNNRASKTEIFKDIQKLNNEEYFSEKHTIRILVKIFMKEIKSISSKKEIIREVTMSKKNNFKELEEYITNLDFFNEFNSLEKIDASSVSKGYGFSGPVKRWGVKLMKRKQSRSKKTRHIGCLSPQGLGKVNWRAPQYGQRGYSRRIIYNLKIIKEKIPEKLVFKNYGFVSENYILVKGSIGGPSKRFVVLSKPRR